MSTPEIETAWRSSGIAGKPVSTHLAFVQGFEAATAEKAAVWQECMDALDAAFGHEDRPWPTNPYLATQKEQTDDHQ